MTFLRIILSPFSLMYGLVTAVRNKLFDWGWMPSVRFGDVTVVCVGNITVGGTGKTPHVEYLIRMLSQRCWVAVLSRGYKRKSKGFVLADSHSTAFEIGDEPCQMKQKYPHLTVAVDADRVRGIRRLKEQYPDIQVVLLDDAFQHRKITPALSILLADYHRPLYADGMLPGGRMREWACFARRADVMIVSKTPPDISCEEQQAIRRRYARFFPKDIYFSHIAYGAPRPVFQLQRTLSADILSSSSVLLVTGIASPKPLEKHLRALAANVYPLPYPDHHVFTQHDVREMVARWQNIPATGKFILTTEKDAVRLRLMDVPDDIQPYIFYVPIETELPETILLEQKLSELLM